MCLPGLSPAWSLEQSTRASSESTSSTPQGARPGTASTSLKYN